MAATRITSEHPAKELTDKTIQTLKRIHHPRNSDQTEKKFDGLYKVAPDVKLHCYIPVCIGYTSPESTVEIAKELAEVLRVIQSQGYDFTIYASPCPKLDEKDEDNYLIWRRDNAELLRGIEHHIVLESEWRATPAWQEAKLKFEAVMRANPDLVNQYLDAEAVNYATRTDKKKLDAGLDNIVEPIKIPVREHITACVIDCISWMSKKPTSRYSNEIGAMVPGDVTELACVLHKHSLGKIYRHVLSAPEIGYLTDSLRLIQPKFVSPEIVNTMMSEATEAAVSSPLSDMTPVEQISPPQQYCQDHAAEMSDTLNFTIDALLDRINSRNATKIGKALLGVAQAYKEQITHAEDALSSPIPIPNASPRHASPTLQGSPSRHGMFGNGSAPSLYAQSGSANGLNVSRQASGASSASAPTAPPLSTRATTGVHSPRLPSPSAVLPRGEVTYLPASNTSPRR